MRGAALRASLLEATEVLAEVADDLVFLGGCVMALYARSDGAPLRATNDVDCLSTVKPWIRQEEVLARLCAEGRLRPDFQHQFRYVVPSTGLVVDVLSPDGLNVGGGSRWLRLAAEHARSYAVGVRKLRAVTPPYFLALKLAALLDRGPDLVSSKDAEDLVCLAIEVDDLVAQVDAAGLLGEVGHLWHAVFGKYTLTADDLPDLVDYHLHRDDAALRDRAITTLRALATP